MAMDNQRPPLSSEWSDLQQKGEVPEKGKGSTAERAERDEERKRRRMPTEDRRTRICPTLSSRLIGRLRSICKTEGYVGGNGNGVIASTVIEDLLWFAVEAYDRGELEGQEEEIIEVRARLRRSPTK